MNIKNILKKISCTGCLLMITLIMGSCDGENLQKFAKTDIVNGINSRFTENRKILGSLKDAGFIAEVDYLRLEQNLTNRQTELFIRDDNGELSPAFIVDGSGYLLKEETLPSAITSVKAMKAGISKGDSSNSTYTETELKTVCMGNYLKSEYGFNIGGSLGSWVNTPGKIIPIKVIDDEVYDFSENFKFEVHVLKGFTDSEAGSTELDAIIDTINKNLEGRTLKSNAGMSTYFEPAKYISGSKKGETILINDLLDIESIICDSKAYSGNTPSGGNRPGYDLSITQTVGTKTDYVMKMRFHEFNDDEVDKLLMLAGVDTSTGEATGKWLFFRGADKIVAYLMEYPVYYVKGFRDTQYKDSNGKKFNDYSEALLAKSDIMVNILNGNMIACDYDDDGYLKSTKLIKNSGNDAYLTFSTNASSYNDANAYSTVPTSSFIISGITSTTIATEEFVDKSSSTQKVDVVTGRLILRDYLELTYAPKFNTEGNENLIAFGRKLRLVNEKVNQIDFDASNLKYEYKSKATIVVGNTGQLGELYNELKDSYISGENFDDTYVISKVVKDEVHAKLIEELDYLSISRDMGYITKAVSLDGGPQNYSLSEMLSIITSHSYCVNQTELYKWIKLNIDFGHLVTPEEVYNYVVAHPLDLSELDSLVKGTEEYYEKALQMVSNQSGFNYSMWNTPGAMSGYGYQGAINRENFKNGKLTGVYANADIEMVKEIQTIINKVEGLDTNSDTYDSVVNDILASMGITTGESEDSTEVSYNSPYESGMLTSNLVPLSTSKLKNTVLKYSKQDYCAIFIDKNGNEIQNSPKLYISDFCDVEYISNPDNPMIKRPTNYGEKPGAGYPLDAESIGANSLVWSADGGFIETTTRFPGPLVGRADYDFDNSRTDSTQCHQIFYAITTTSDMFTTSLFSSWINSSNPDASLYWWRNWLKQNKYLYSIDATSLESYILKNYKYELGNSDVIILDLDVISKIQDEMDKDADSRTDSTIRTAFKILGWALIFLGIFLVVAWLIDTNIDLGFNILTKITFGLMIPVKYSSDIPTADIEKRNYVLLSDILVRSLVVCVAGILLILLDVYDIVNFLIDIFGGLTRGIVNLFNLG